MARANDSIEITPGSGAVVATQKVAGKDYQSMVLARPDGHMEGSFDVYGFFGLALAKAASRNYMGIMNYPNSNVMVEITSASVWEETTAAVTGLVRGYRLFRMTSMSGGTQIANANIGKLDLARPDPVAGVSFQRGAITTLTGASTEPIGACAINEEETGAGGIMSFLFQEAWTGQPILLSTGQGVAIQQDGTAGVGTVGCAIYFRILS